MQRATFLFMGLTWELVEFFFAGCLLRFLPTVAFVDNVDLVPSF